MKIFSVDIVAVMIATVVSVLIGSVWYSRLLFGKKEKTSFPTWQFIGNAVLALISAYVLGFLIAFLKVTTVNDGMFVGLMCWFGFIAPTIMSSVIWGKMTLKHFLVHTGFQLISLTTMGGILAA